MEILHKIKQKIGLEDKKEAKQSRFLEPIDGLEEYREPLSTLIISYSFCSIAELCDAKFIQLIAAELNVPEETVLKDIERIKSGMRDDLVCCVEYPYVEEYYRDSYYAFYSRKHNAYSRYCFRISFFYKSVTEEIFYTENLDDRFFGYMVLRPTPKRIIGYTFFDPKIYVEHHISICLCQRTVSIMGQWLNVSGFPFMGQDAEMNQCAETALVSMFDYFSRKYNRYSRLLPSQIASVQSESVTNRKLPSKGICPDIIADIIGVNGMSTRYYDKNDYDDDNDEYKRILQIYVDSGFPIYAFKNTHALLIIGRESKPFPMDAKLVVMDDNERPYRVEGSIDDIDSFIVPMPDNVMQDAEDMVPSRIIKVISGDYPDINFVLDEDMYYNRMCLSTSRLLKKWVIDSNLSNENKSLIIGTAMPRFIWISEWIHLSKLSDSFSSMPLDCIAVFDATDYPNGYDHLLLVKTPTKLLLPTFDKTKLRRKVYFAIDSVEEVYPFQNNLKMY